jgi:hypothetical protein
MVLATRGIGLVYGGGDIGLMGEIANACLAEGGEVVGVIPEFMMEEEFAHHEVTQLHVVGSMHERKAMMAALSDAFVALPGGWGTLEELAEITTWAQLGLHGKPVGVLNVAGFFDDFVSFLDHATDEGFVKPAHRALLLVEDDINALLDRMSVYGQDATSKWDATQT